MLLFVARPDTRLEPPEFVVVIETVTVEVGQDAFFECQAVGYPLPDITWYKNGREIIPVDRNFNVTSNDKGNSQLLISNVQKEHAGKITAEAINAVGIEFCEADLKVKGEI